MKSCTKEKVYSALRPLIREALENDSYIKQLSNYAKVNTADNVFLDKVIRMGRKQHELTIKMIAFELITKPNLKL